MTRPCDYPHITFTLPNAVEKTSDYSDIFQFTLFYTEGGGGTHGAKLTFNVKFATVKQITLKPLVGYWG